MSRYSEEDSFAAALHQAAGTLPAPDPEALYDASLRRGRAIRRRRRAGAGMSAGFALCAAVTLVITLNGPAAGGPATGAAAGVGESVSSLPSPSADTTATPGTAQALPAPSGSLGVSASPPVSGNPSASATPTGGTGTGAVTSAQMLQSFEALLPSGAVVLQRGGDGGPMATTPSKDVVSGLWNSQVAVTLQSPGIGSFVIFSLYQGAWARSCAQAENRTGVSTSCTTTSLAGGKLFTVMEPGNGGGMNPVEYFVWLSPAGYTTEVSISDSSVADFQLTTAEVKGILTNATWPPLAGRLAG